MNKTELKALNKLLIEYKKLSDEQAKFEQKYNEDPEYRAMVDEARKRQKSIERQKEIAARQRADREFEEKLKSPEFKSEVLEEMKGEGIDEVVAMNLINSPAKLLDEARKRHLI